MSRELVQEGLVAVGFIALLVLLANPFHFWMPNMMMGTLLVALVVLFALFSSFVWREQVRDEREELHRTLAGRWAFFAGAVGLLVGVVAQAVQHDLDPWLLVGLGAMVVGKIGGLVYSRYFY